MPETPAGPNAPLLRRAAAVAAIAGATSLLALNGFAAVGELVPADKGPAGRALYLWMPAESYPAGAQYDPRLDQPVRFWRAGISLAELATEVEIQTGVAIGFWPGADENPRLRLNVFLNAEEPPTLRDLLAQLAWVTGCTFACTSPTELTDYVYYLLDSSLAGGASERWCDLKIARSFTDEDRRERSRQQHIAATGAMLEELREVLRLSHNALIARYRNRNDRLLLTLLDPQRRAAAEFVCGRMSYRDDDSRWYRIGEDWGALSEAEKALLRTAFPWMKDVEETGQLRVSAVGAHIGRIELSVSAPVSAMKHGRATAPGYVVGSSRLAAYPIVVIDSRQDAVGLGDAADILRLAALLGESVPEGEEAAYVEAYAGSQWEAAQQREWERWCQRTAADRHLSNAAIDLLSQTEWPLDHDDHSMGEVQAAVARETGMHVVSDCFWQPAQRVDEEVDSAYKGLVLLCPISPLTDATQPEFALGWEWADAGSFLRFRSLHRDVFRASMLPEGTIEELDRIAEPHLPAIADTADPPTELTITLPIDLPRLVAIARGLSDLQCRYGGRIAYEDPTDFAAACRVAARGALLEPFGDRYGFFRFILSLDEAQWRLAQSDRGLTCTRDLDESQIAALENSILEVVGYALRVDMSHPEFMLRTQGTLLNPFSGDDVLTAAIRFEPAEPLPPLPSGQSYRGPLEWSVPSHVRARVTYRALVENEDTES
ncbi:MAG TPA: hypothetical protein VMY87_03940 [Armatimonadota bacterium]|nr:hypothetical protein [Armatimonadota bacterium]